MVSVEGVLYLITGCHFRPQILVVHHNCPKGLQAELQSSGIIQWGPFTEIMKEPHKAEKLVLAMWYEWDCSLSYQRIKQLWRLAAMKKPNGVIWLCWPFNTDRDWTEKQQTQADDYYGKKRMEFNSSVPTDPPLLLVCSSIMSCFMIKRDFCKWWKLL